MSKILSHDARLDGCIPADISRQIVLVPTGAERQSIISVGTVIVSSLTVLPNPIWLC